MKFKSKINSEKIEKAIADFEAKVDFELVPVITERSSYSEHIGWMISLIILVIFLETIELFFQDSWASTTIYYVVAPLVATILGHLLDRSDLVDRFFISKRERQRQTFEKAQRIFFLKQLHATKKNNSLMLFISVMERRIVILPDPRLKLAGLEALQTKLIEIIGVEFKKGQFEDGFLKAIAFLETELAGNFPKSGSNANQYSNKLIWWND
ncbi:MAG: hypothetical protein H7061_10245 [Bdellovibrionaceae bacterium]|nr:hypothetical protein [Bdellovibrio sp.]